MASRSKPRVTNLGGQSMVEHSHLAEECLAQAYERLVPLLSRRRPVPSPPAPASPPSTKRRVGGNQS